MEKTYTLEELAALATQTAQAFDAEVIRWWQDGGDPRALHIEARLKDKHISVLLLAILDTDT